MSFDPFKEMQKAVDIVGDSRHPTSKVAATIFGKSPSGEPFSIAKTNYWPKKIVDTIGKGKDVGNSSGTIHAETACILAAPLTSGAALCVTDPFCPNCAKNIAESGIKTVYIDHKGFAKDFAERRGEHFTGMSMRLCEKAGISVYEIHRRDKTLTPIHEAPDIFIPHEDSPVEIERVSAADDTHFRALIDLKTEIHRGRTFAVALAKNHRGDVFGLTARRHPATGYAMDADIGEIENPEGKYNFMQEPVNRLLMAAPRNGLKITGNLIFCSRVPTSREQVNLIGAGVTSVTVRALSNARDDWALAAMKTLAKNGVLTFYGL